MAVENEKKKVSKEVRYMNLVDFTYAVTRLDTIDHTIGNIVQKVLIKRITLIVWYFISIFFKIDKLFMFLELMEVEKMERRKNIVNLVSIYPVIVSLYNEIFFLSKIEN